MGGRRRQAHKLHYSDQWPGKPPRAHAATVDVEAFRRFYERIADFALDIMLEVKDKEQSVLKLYQMIPGLGALNRFTSD